MSIFRIRGGKKLKGEIRVNGSKNSATKLIAATLLTEKTCILRNVPQVRDVFVMLDIIARAGADVKRRGHTVTINTKNINPDFFRGAHDIERLRASIVFLGPLLARFGKACLPYPGGDLIGARPLTAHFNAFDDLGFQLVRRKDFFEFQKKPRAKKIQRVALDEFSVTATENVLMYAAMQPYKIKISTAAYEPHVQDLAELLNKMGAHIEFKPFHEITVQGKKSLQGAKHTVIADYLEAGTFIILGLAAAQEMTITNVPLAHLELFLQKLQRSGALIHKKNSRIISVKHSPNMKLGKIQTMIYPGVPTDLQQPLGVLATQLRGETLIHDPLYERRMRYLSELQKMGANIKILDDHRALIYGPRKLHGCELRHFDIRGGMSFIIAGLVASGITMVHNADEVDRGYENIEGRLKKLGADIERV